MSERYVRAAVVCVAGLLSVVAAAACVGDSPTATGPTGEDGGNAGDSGSPTQNDATAPVDSGASDAGAVDAATDATTGPACDLTKPFSSGATTMLAALDTDHQEYSPRLSADELTIYYARYPGIVGTDTAPAPDIFTATRSSIADAFPPGTPLLSVDTPHTQQDPSLSPDGLTLYYAVDYLTTTCTDLGLCIAKATRTSLTNDFSSPVILVDEHGSQAEPYAAGANVYYTTHSATTMGDDLTNVGQSTAFAIVNSAADESSPVLSPDELTLYFSSNRTSDASTDGDIWKATRTSKTDPFAAPTHVDELSTNRDENPGFVSPDGCRIYFSRDDGTGQSYNLYVASKPAK